MRKLFTWDEITADLKDGQGGEIVQLKQLPQYLFTYNKELNQCDMWVSQGMTSYEESLWQLVNMLPFEGSWDEYRDEALVNYMRAIYIGWFQSNLPEELLFQV